MTSNSKQELHLAIAFLPPVMDPDYALSVIDRALDYRDEASDSVRSRLNSVIKDGVSIPGFQDASRAHRHQLRDPVLAAILTGTSEKLAVEILRCWAESNETLRMSVTDHFRSRGVPTEGPDLQSGTFKSTWSRYEWAAESELIVSGDTSGRFDADDIALMLCYVSGRLPTEEAQIGSPLLQEWFDKLVELPPGALEWDYVYEFASSVTGLAYAKISERTTVQIQQIDRSIKEINEEFDQELSYLELDLSAWSSDAAEAADAIDNALESLNELNSALSEYRPVRPQASSRSEESQRAPEREKWEERVLEIAASWDEMMDVPEGQGDDGIAQQPDNASDTDAVEAVLAAIQHRDTGDPELRRLRQANNALRSENDQLQQDGEHLRADVSTLKDQIGQLRNELSQSNEMEEYWRRAYVLESARQVGTEEDGSVVLSNVTDALDLAARSFPDRLRIALNSKSNSDTPFQKPDEVFEALGWLATEYHRLRTNPGDAPNFDKLIKAACPGWSYKPKQTEVTKDQFSEWYTTTLDGKSYGLDAHIGKGTSFDPQNTIRIAFDWDDELKQVIVGYVGRHQRNRRS